LLWDQSFCFTSPVALGYTRGHFTALVTMEDRVKVRDGFDRRARRTLLLLRQLVNAA